jgi:hypothetical protein
VFGGVKNKDERKEGREKLDVFYCLVEERKMRGRKIGWAFSKRAHQIFLSQLERKWERIS